MSIDWPSACFVLKGNIACIYRIHAHRNGAHLRIFQKKHLSELNTDYVFLMALPILHSLEEEAKRCWPRVDIHSVPLSCRIRKLSNCGVGEDSWKSLGQPIKPVNPKGNHPWIFTGRTDDEAETPILWQPDEKSRIIGKDPDAGKDWGHEEKEVTEDEMVGWHHWLNGHEFEQTQGYSEGQRSLVCFNPWGRKESDMT